MSDHPLVSRVPGSKRPDNKCIQGHLKPLAPELLCNASVLLQLLSTLIPQGLVAVFEGNGNINNRYTPIHSVYHNQVGTKIKLRAVRDPPVHSHGLLFTVPRCWCRHESSTNGSRYAVQSDINLPYIEHCSYTGAQYSTAE